MRRLQPNFKTDGIRNFMYTEHNRDNAKLRIFSFIPQRQRIQPNFMNHTYQTTNQTNTTRTTKKTTLTWVSPLKFVLLQLRQHKYWSIQISQLINEFCTFHPSPLCTLHLSRKTCTWLEEQFCTKTTTPTWVLPLKFVLLQLRQHKIWSTQISKPSKKVVFICFNESPIKMMKNAFNFKLKL